ncbi:MAG: hypothetical protein WCO84_02055 [bacterium]
MKSFFLDKKRFFCFSPEVMILTFTIEILLAIYVFLRYKASSFVHTSIFLLVLLSLFQFSEYNVCGGGFVLPWSRFGFFVITIIPISMLELISNITKERRHIEQSYFLMFFFLAVFAFLPEVIIQAVCKGNYIMFETAWHGVSLTYLFYYFGILFLGMWKIAKEFLRIKSDKSKSDKADLLIWLFVGYLTFLVPTGVVDLVTQLGLEIIPSVLCGFAVIFAFILSFKVVPLAKKIGL